MTSITDKINMGFTIYFCLEMVIKLLALGVRGYLSDSWNIFDGLVTLMGLADLIMVRLSHGGRGI